ncbi:3D domain-containing protein [Bacillus velezensis]|uniref:3D domain-containing protein n=1 Tax=Bacillus velezensis TaxID=492670 RepID=UPI002DBCB21C|nr:3D domain-containing protein [Bacillus velezensis]MEC3678177.1 3D domain-containing protein [Bacillus velezensis]
MSTQLLTNPTAKPPELPPPDPPRITEEEYALQEAEALIEGKDAELAAKDAKIKTLQSELASVKDEVKARANEKREKPSHKHAQTSGWQTFEVTAYTSGYSSTGKSRNDADYGITASGERAVEGRTLACPPSLPFGTKVNIEGIGERVCEDRGGAIQEGHLDLYMTSESEALSFGRRNLSAEITD